MIYPPNWDKYRDYSLGCLWRMIPNPIRKTIKSLEESSWIKGNNKTKIFIITYFNLIYLMSVGNESIYRE